ncbi:hypothetical protein BGZ73_004363 [Actinomortierella ambigua]|nr:hypothetical protein BGZ73_004363 [Actinomortierella ambigua]
MRITSTILRQVEFGVYLKTNSELSVLVAMREECPVEKCEARLDMLQAKVIERETSLEASDLVGKEAWGCAMKQLQSLGFGHSLDQTESANNSRFHYFSVHGPNAARDEHVHKLYATRDDFNEAATCRLAGLTNFEELTLCHDVMRQTTKEGLRQWKVMWPKLRKIHGCAFQSEQEADNIIQWAKVDLKTLSLTRPRTKLF